MTEATTRWKVRSTLLESQCRFQRVDRGLVVPEELVHDLLDSGGVLRRDVDLRFGRLLFERGVVPRLGEGLLKRLEAVGGNVWRSREGLADHRGRRDGLDDRFVLGRGCDLVGHRHVREVLDLLVALLDERYHRAVL